MNDGGLTEEEKGRWWEERKRGIAKIFVFLLVVKEGEFLANRADRSKFALIRAKREQRVEQSATEQGKAVEPKDGLEKK